MSGRVRGEKGDSVSAPPPLPVAKLKGKIHSPGRMSLQKRSGTEGQATVTYRGDHVVKDLPKITEHLSNCILQTKPTKMHIHTVLHLAGFVFFFKCV